jgi:radical SAM protein with 4Fe4S-binding SPASM domain
MKPVRKTVSLAITQSCNLSCSYCYEDHKSKQVMSLDTAINIVERYLASSSEEYDECVIEFFGGEPFLNFSLIKQVCEYVWERQWRKPYLFFATTNGTLIHGEIQNWLLNHKDQFNVALSLDGTQKMHDINRSKSFSKIDLAFFRNTWTDTPVKMTISRETLPDLAEGVIYLHSLGFSITNNLAYGIDWSDNENVKILFRELEKLTDYYLENPDIKPCRLLDMKIEYLSSNNEKKWCGVATDMIMFDWDGVNYPCNGFLPIAIGKQKATEARNIDFTLIENFIDPRCKGCLLQSICPTCYGINYDETGNMATRNEQLCRFTKIGALACSYMKAKKVLSKGNITELGGDDYLVVKSAIQIQRQFAMLLP